MLLTIETKAMLEHNLVLSVRQDQVIYIVVMRIVEIYVMNRLSFIMAFAVYYSVLTNDLHYQATEFQAPRLPPACPYLPPFHRLDAIPSIQSHRI
jgi:hypothetical protein